MINSNMTLKLGRNPYIKDYRDLILDDYLRRETLPVIPDTFGHENLINAWGMLGNDTVGDCVVASSEHLVMEWTKEGSNITAPMTKATALKDYANVCGYDPSDPYGTDNGCDMRTMMAYMKNTGIVDANGKKHKIGAYTGIDLTKGTDLLIAAAYLFSGVKIGIDFPDSAMTQFNNGQPWSVVKGSPIDGGHDVPVIGRDSKGILCVTWGKLQYMTLDFLKTYCTEAWVGFSPEFLNTGGLSPEGLNVDQLNYDLAIVGSLAPPGPAPAPGPAPTPNKTCDQAIQLVKADIITAQAILKKSTSKYAKSANTELTKALVDIIY